jgi:RNA recognition motif-containing protein
MSLFVGNVSKNVDPREFERKFQSFGSVRVDKRVSSELQDWRLTF